MSDSFTIDEANAIMLGILNCGDYMPLMSSLRKEIDALPNLGKPDLTDTERTRHQNSLIARAVNKIHEQHGSDVLWSEEDEHAMFSYISLMLHEMDRDAGKSWAKNVSRRGESGGFKLH